MCEIGFRLKDFSDELVMCKLLAIVVGLGEHFILESAVG